MNDDRFRMTRINFHIKFPDTGEHKSGIVDVPGRYTDADFQEKAQKAIQSLNPGSAFLGMAPTFGHVHYIAGDLLEQNSDLIIAHQANCHMKMYSGIAGQLRRKYPFAVDADINFPLSSQDRFGKCSCGFGQGTNGSYKYVYNLYGQFEPGTDTQKTDYKQLKSALNMMMEHLHMRGIDDSFSHIGVPYKLGCGLAGGHWPKVEEILQEVAAEHQRDIYVYVLPDFVQEVFQEGESEITLPRWSKY
ncbi:Macro domain protein [compost metagenome]